MARRQSNGNVAHLTVRILQEIRDEVRKTNARLDQTNARLDQTNARLDQTNARLEQTNAGIEHGFAELRGRIDHLVAFIGERYRDQSRALLSLDRRVTKVEQALRSSH